MQSKVGLQNGPAGPFDEAPSTIHCSTGKSSGRGLAQETLCMDKHQAELSSQTWLCTTRGSLSCDDLAPPSLVGVREHTTPATLCQQRICVS